jgi:hypothetical protein
LKVAISGTLARIMRQRRYHNKEQRMRKADIAKVLVWAAASFAGAIYVITPSHLNATDAPGAQKTAVVRPTLTVNDVQFSVVFADEVKLADSSAARVFKAGAMPDLELVATNPTNSSKTVPLTINVAMTPPTSPMSRTVPMPESKWTREDKVTLSAGQTIRIPLHTKLSLKKGEGVLVQLIGDKKEPAISALRFAAESIPLAELQPRKLAAKNSAS